MDDNKNTRMWILRAFIGMGLLVYLGYSICWMSTQVLQSQLQTEINASRYIMPSDKWASVIARTESVFATLINEYRFRDHLNQVLLPEVKTGRGLNLVAEQAMSFNYTAARNIPLLIFQALYRCFLLLGWAFTFAPFLIAFILDGLYQWKLKRFQFGKVTIQFYRVWIQAFKLMSFLIVAYLLIPNVTIFDNVAQLFPPLALIILGIALNQLWANYQKLM